MSKDTQTNSRPIWILVVWGFVAGNVISVLAAFFTGAGHGWASAVDSSLSLAGAPLAGAAWAARGKKKGNVCAYIAVLIALVVDVLLWSSTAKEGFSYVGKVWDFMPVPLVLWFILFLGWQFVAAAALVVGPKKQLV